MEHEEKLRRLHSLECRFIEIAEQEAALDAKAIDYKGLGDVTDMIKDIGLAIKDCHEAKYYETVVEAMNEYDDENGRMGYDMYRYANGQYAPKGHGHHSPVTARSGRRGYVPPMIPDPSVRDGWIDEYERSMPPRHYYHDSEHDGEGMMLNDIRAMLSQASPELKKRIKSEISEI